MTAFTANSFTLASQHKNTLEAGDTILSQMPHFMEQEQEASLSCQPQPQPNTNTPLGHPKRKKGETQPNFMSPLNDHDNENPSPKRARLISPSTHPVTLHPNPQTLHPNLYTLHPNPHPVPQQIPLPPINLKDYVINTYVPVR